jgi:hypothetical protein|nr:MAG TPA: hypothetical protein [Caudoviricetes sp.]
MYHLKFNLRKEVIDMNLEQAKSKKAQLETEVESVRQELYNQSIEKSKLDAQVQNIQNEMELKSRSVNLKQQEINTLATAIEVMER